MNSEKDRRETMNIVTAGHVDHGKSTVIGRLLCDTGALPKGKLTAIREKCRQNDKPFEYAFLLDALKNEQAQGITIETARCFFQSEKRHYILIDAPGHVEFLKNMITGASRAQAALLVIDASHGVEENTRRHGYFLSMLGISQIAVMVNKMDLVGYRRDIFESVVSDFQRYAAKIGLAPQAYIPVSGMAGDNIANHSKNMPWYTGRNTLEQLDAFVTAAPECERPLRMPVQGVYKFTGNGDSRRIVAGEIAEGTLRRGDELVFYPSGKRTRVQSLERFSHTSPECFSIGEAAGFTMEEQIFLRRGEVACRADETPPEVGVRLRANLFWLGRSNLVCDKNYILKCGSARASARVERVERILNAADLSRKERQYVEKNEVTEIILSLNSPLAFETSAHSQSLSRFVLVDGFEIAGGGIITEALVSRDFDERNIRWTTDALDPGEREQALAQKGLVVWMTGLSGAGKTTLAQEAERRLVRAGVNAFTLDGDRMRRGLSADLGFTDRDRVENLRRAMQVANMFKQAGVVVLATFISPFRESRARARRLTGDDFFEVYVKASVETCQKRDPKGLYKKAREGDISGFTGIDAPYEIPDSPDLLLDTERFGEEECADMLTDEIFRRLHTRPQSNTL